MRLPLFVQAATFPTFVRAPRSKWLSCKLLLNRPPILTWHQLTPLLTHRTVFSKAGLFCLNSYCPVPFSAEIFCPPLLFLVCSCFHYFIFLPLLLLLLLLLLYVCSCCGTIFFCCCCCSVAAFLSPCPLSRLTIFSATSN